MGVGQGKVFARASGKLQLSERSTSSLESECAAGYIHAERRGACELLLQLPGFTVLCEREIMRENSKCSTRLRQAEIISSCRDLNSEGINKATDITE